MQAFGNRHHLPQAARVVHCDRKQRSCALRTCAIAEVQVAEDVKQPSAESQTPAPSPATGLAKVTISNQTNRHYTVGC